MNPSLCIGLDDVRGEIVGNVSRLFAANLQTVERWPAHGRTITYPVRLHHFWGEGTAAEALADYQARNRRESRLGDGSPCVVTLELAAA